MKSTISGMNNSIKKHKIKTERMINKKKQTPRWVITALILCCMSLLLGACSSNAEDAEVAQVVTAVPTSEPTAMPEPTTAPTEVVATEVVEEPPTSEPTSTPNSTVEPTDEPASIAAIAVFDLPERSGPRTQTTGSVPHVQIDVEPVPAVDDELHRLVFALPGVEDNPTIVSLPGATGMWLRDDMALARPDAIVRGREFAHIHPDGSLHAPLPFDRALEVAEKGWGERHPWATEREGWEGFVMLYTPQSMEELEITFQLIVESYNHVTGQMVQAADIK